MNKTIILRAKKVRTFLIANPGSTLSQIHEAHPGDNLAGGIGFLQSRRMVRQEGGGKKGPARWFATPANIVNTETPWKEGA